MKAVKLYFVKWWEDLVTWFLFDSLLTSCLTGLMGRQLRSLTKIWYLFCILDHSKWFLGQANIKLINEEFGRWQKGWVVRIGWRFSALWVWSQRTCFPTIKGCLDLRSPKIKQVLEKGTSCSCCSIALAGSCPQGMNLLDFNVNRNNQAISSCKGKQQLSWLHQESACGLCQSVCWNSPKNFYRCCKIWCLVIPFLAESFSLLSNVFYLQE